MARPAMPRDGVPQVSALVTGAGGHLGAAIARALSARGCRLVLSDVASEPLRALTGELTAAGGSAAAVLQDLTTATGASAAVGEALAVTGEIDVCVNAAGIEGRLGPIEELEMTEVARVFDVNVFGLLRVMQAVIPHLVGRGGGRIINIASGAGLAAGAHMAAYSSSKHAVIGLTRTAAVELAARNVAVNAVCPGCVDSPMMERIEAGLASRAEGAPASVTAIPMGRFAQAGEVAAVVAFLALDAPLYLTGATLVVDGGMRA